MKIKGKSVKNSWVGGGREGEVLETLFILYFETGSCSVAESLAKLTLNFQSSCLSLPSRWDYMCAPPLPCNREGKVGCWYSPSIWSALKSICGEENRGVRVETAKGFQREVWSPPAGHR
uniref:Uncharacterized protein n=1 Tax=Sciurus vulgaris TaxID=55149 RepID=A0A8D2ANZ7_SCIVU